MFVYILTNQSHILFIQVLPITWKKEYSSIDKSLIQKVSLQNITVRNLSTTNLAEIQNEPYFEKNK